MYILYCLCSKMSSWAKNLPSGGNVLLSPAFFVKSFVASLINSSLLSCSLTSCSSSDSSSTAPLTCPKMPSASAINMSQFTLPNDQPVISLDAK